MEDDDAAADLVAFLTATAEAVFLPEDDEAAAREPRDDDEERNLFVALSSEDTT